MTKKIVKPNLANDLKNILTSSVHKALKDNNSELTDKFQRAVNKFIKRIVKKTDRQIKKLRHAE